MAARGLLYHPQHARPPSYTANPRHWLPARFFPPFEGFASTSLRRGLSSFPAFRSVQCVTFVNEAARVSPRAGMDSSNGGNPDVVEWVNKAAPGPMVEVDPVTVFRRIIAERTASLALARANQQAGRMDTIQSTATASPLSLFGRKLPGKSVIAIAVALVFLALAVAFYFRRSRADGKKQTELNSAEGQNSSNVPTDDSTCKLVKNTIEAPDSILTAMAIGAASIGRPKGHTGSSHVVPHVANGNRVDTQRPESGAGYRPIVNTTGIMDMQTEGHRNPPFGQLSYNPNNLEGFGSFKTQNAGADVAEGPWFSQAADDTEDLQPLNKVAVEQLVTEISVSEVCYETPSLSNVVDGEFLGEVVAASVATEEAVEVSLSKVENFKCEEPEDDGILADSSAIVEKLEQIIAQESINRIEVNQLLTPLQVGNGAAFLEEPQTVIQTYGGEPQTAIQTTEESQTSIQTSEEPQMAIETIEEPQTAIEAFEGPRAAIHAFEEPQAAIQFIEEPTAIKSFEEPQTVIQTIEEPQTAIQAVEDLQTDGSLSINENSDQNSGTFANGSLAAAALQSLEEDPRVENMKALEAALPALAIGVGTVGAVFGVTGGLQVVGFAALARFLSQDFFWAESREELWQEVKGITDRQKLLDFLARRNVVKKNGEESSL